MLRRAPALLVFALLGGCVGGSSQLAPQLAQIAPAASVPSTVPATMYIPPRDIDRPLIIQATLHRNEQVSMNDGRTLESAAKKVLSQVFTAIPTNQTNPAPQLVIKVSGTPKYYRKDGFMKTGCVLDFYGSDGAALGQFVGRFETTEPVDYKDALEPAYAICFKRAADQALASPTIQRAMKPGAPAPNPAAYRAFIEGLGLRP